MATNLSIDPELIEMARKVSGERTKAATVTKALREFIARRRQKRLLDLVGKLEWRGDFDYKKGRSRTSAPSSTQRSKTSSSARRRDYPPRD